MVGTDGSDQLGAGLATVSYSPERDGVLAHDGELPGHGELVGGKYLVEGVIGSGGMGVVVAARQLELGQKVAIKFVRIGADSAALTRFRREARIAARMRSEHMARLMDYGNLESGQPFLVMEYLQGESAAQCIRERGPCTPAEASDWVSQAALGLAEAHRLGIVHRDLKPSNLFLTRRADGSVLVKVLDFGIAKLIAPTNEQGHDITANEELTATTVVLGSPSYMAPEQVRCARDVDGRADVWSLGVVLYELLTGALPFEGKGPSAVMAAIVADPPIPLSERRPTLPDGFEAVILRCLAKDRDHRFTDLAELSRALKPYAVGDGRSYAQRTAETLRNTSREKVDPIALEAKAHAAEPMGSETSTGASMATELSLRSPASRAFRSSRARALLRSVALLLAGAAGTYAIVQNRPHGARGEPTAAATSPVFSTPQPTATVAETAPKAATTAEPSATPPARAHAPTPSALRAATLPPMTRAAKRSPKQAAEPDIDAATATRK